MGNTTTVETTTTVEIPAVEDRKLRTYYVISNYVGEVQHIDTDRASAEAKLKQLATGRNGELPKLVLTEAKGVPTDAELADEKKKD